jgi:hypothetical protein
MEAAAPAFGGAVADSRSLLPGFARVLPLQKMNSRPRIYDFFAIGGHFVSSPDSVINFYIDE